MRIRDQDRLTDLGDVEDLIQTGANLRQVTTNIQKTFRHFTKIEWHMDRNDELHWLNECDEYLAFFFFFLKNSAGSCPGPL